MPIMPSSHSLGMNNPTSLPLAQLSPSHSSDLATSFSNSATRFAISSANSWVSQSSRFHPGAPALYEKPSSRQLLIYDFAFNGFVVGSRLGSIVGLSLATLGISLIQFRPNRHDCISQFLRGSLQLLLVSTLVL